MDDGSHGLFMELKKESKNKIFDLKLNEKIVEKMVAELSYGKSVGLRGVSHEMLKYSNTQKQSKFLCTFFETMINNQVVPEAFNISVIKPVIKNDSKPNNDLSNIRPIAISDAIANMYERILLNEIKKDNTDHKKQFGFKEKSSCAHAVEMLNQALVVSKVRNKKLYICAVDASKAFDKVSREKMWVIMTAKNVRPCISLAIRKYCENSYMVIQIAENFSKPFKTTV